MSTPCKTGDPDDWFVRPDGKQYPFDEILDHAERRRIALSVLARADESAESLLERREAAIRAAERSHRRAALIRRRKAREACHLECPVRTQCLELAMETRPGSGTWGGYYEEELAQIFLELDRRRRGREPSLPDGR